MTDPMSPEELRACRERAEAPVTPPHGQLVKQIALGQDVPALLATIAAAQRETTSLRHAALFAAGIHGGPHAWRWASDPQGTILDDVAAWERMLGEMRERTGRRAPVQGNLPRRGAGTVAWDEHVLAWSAYAVRHGRSQSAERIADRGGFGYAELASLLGHEPKTWTPASE